MDFLRSLLDNSSILAITAFILGILTAVNPRPLVTDITTIGSISKDIENRHRVFINGLFYAFGRVVSCTIFGFILVPILREEASTFAVQKVVSKYAGILVVPASIIIGIFTLDVIKLSLPKINIGGEGLKKRIKGGWGAMLSSILFALASYPASGALYFSMFVPSLAAETSGYLSPIIYAITAGLPVTPVTWILAYSVAELGKFCNWIQVSEKWLREMVAIPFTAVGIYYIIVFYLQA